MNRLIALAFLFCLTISISGCGEEEERFEQEELQLPTCIDIAMFADQNAILYNPSDESFTYTIELQDGPIWDLETIPGSGRDGVIGPGEFITLWKINPGNSVRYKFGSVRGNTRCEGFRKFPETPCEVRLNYIAPTLSVENNLDETIYAVILVAYLEEISIQVLSSIEVPQNSSVDVELNLETNQGWIIAYFTDEYGNKICLDNKLAL